MLVAFQPCADQRLVGLHAELRQTAQEAAQPIGVDGVGAAAAEVGDAACAHLQQHAGHLVGRAHLVVVGLRDLRVVNAADRHKGGVVLLQQIDAGVVRHGAGQDDAVDFVAGKLALQLVGVGLTDVAE